MIQDQINSDKCKKKKIDCLKLKSEVGMALLKCKQTRLVGIISTYMYVVHPYACFLSLIMFLFKLVN